MKYIIKNADMLSEVTRKVIKNFNTMTEKDFFYKYQCSKKTYLKRLLKYGDPYMNSPLAKIGKLLKCIRIK